MAVQLGSVGVHQAWQTGDQVNSTGFVELHLPAGGFLVSGCPAVTRANVPWPMK